MLRLILSGRPIATVPQDKVLRSVGGWLKRLGNWPNETGAATPVAKWRTPRPNISSWAIWLLLIAAPRGWAWTEISKVREAGRRPTAAFSRALALTVNACSKGSLAGGVISCQPWRQAPLYCRKLSTSSDEPATLE